MKTQFSQTLAVKKSLLQFQWRYSPIYLSKVNMEAGRHHIKLKSQIEKIIWITLIWTLLSLFQFLFGYARPDQFDCVPNDIGGLLIGAILAGIIVGLIGGSFIVFN